MRYGHKTADKLHVESKWEAEVANELILATAPLGMHWPTLDPFVLLMRGCAPCSNTNMGISRELLGGRDIGADFSGKDGWSMYHGNEVQAFLAILTEDSKPLLSREAAHRPLGFVGCNRSIWRRRRSVDDRRPGYHPFGDVPAATKRGR